jgi:hypothetical protein
MVRAFTEGKGDDSQLHESLVRQGIITIEQCKALIEALETADEIWPPLLRAFNSARVPSTRGLFKLFPMLRPVGRHKRSGGMTAEQFRTRCLEVIANCYGLPGRGINQAENSGR